MYDGVNGQALTIAPGVTEEAYCDFGLGEQNRLLEVRLRTHCECSKAYGEQQYGRGAEHDASEWV